MGTIRFYYNTGFANTYKKSIILGALSLILSLPQLFDDLILPNNLPSYCFDPDQLQSMLIIKKIWHSKNKIDVERSRHEKNKLQIK